MGILSRLKGANIADLDRQIVIKSTTISTGDAGEQIPGAVTSSTVWAKVDYRFGDEDVEANRVEMNSRVEFTVRYFSGITNKHWIEFDGFVFDIIHIEEKGRKRFHVLLTEKRV